MSQTQIDRVGDIGLVLLAWGLAAVACVLIGGRIHG